MPPYLLPFSTFLIPLYFTSNGCGTRGFVPASLFWNFWSSNLLSLIIRKYILFGRGKESISGCDARTCWKGPDSVAYCKRREIRQRVSNNLHRIVKHSFFFHGTWLWGYYNVAESKLVTRTYRYYKRLQVIRKENYREVYGTNHLTSRLSSNCIQSWHGKLFEYINILQYISVSFGQIKLDR
jgi:hypothetical protein